MARALIGVYLIAAMIGFVQVRKTTTTTKPIISRTDCSNAYINYKIKSNMSCDDFEVRYFRIEAGVISGEVYAQINKGKL